jgi:hypothetical protein
MKRWVAWLLASAAVLSVIAATAVGVTVGVQRHKKVDAASARAQQCANGVCYMPPRGPTAFTPTTFTPTAPTPTAFTPTPKPKPKPKPKPQPEQNPPKRKPAAPPPAKPVAPPPAKPVAPPPAKPVTRPTTPAPVAPTGGAVPSAVPGATCTQTMAVDKFPAGKVSGKTGPGVPMKADNGVLAVTCLPGKYASDGGVIYRFPTCAGKKEVLVSFDVKFGDSAAFDFVKGGKAGWGLSFGTEKFQGGTWPKNSASARVMWRKGGQATGYAYYGSKSNGADPKEQLPEYADVGRSTGSAGHTLWETGKSKQPMVNFKSGVWQTVRLYVRMNSAGAHDGAIGIAVDGDARRFDKMKWVESPVGLDNAEFCTWFGGSDASWSPRTPQTIYYRNFQFSAK